MANERPPVEHVTLMQLKIAKLTELETAGFVVDSLAEGDGGWICPVNLDVLRQVSHDNCLRQLVAGADLIVADGMPLLWASRMQGEPLPQRVAGSSLISSLSLTLRDHGRSVYLLGGNEGSAEAACAQLHDTLPGLALRGWHCPPFGFERSTAELDRILARLEAAQPDVVFVGLGFPKQDRLIAELRPVLPAAWFVSCGISFSFLTGEVRRAPPVLQKAGLEWVHRLMQEPQRLARRYLLDDPPFAMRLFAASLSARIGTARPALARAPGGEAEW
jgi:N-acetylglucosaminyldiphosphoundecaprenol N-acetyl-beta-D-mannosaminyltransferase